MKLILVPAMVAALVSAGMFYLLHAINGDARPVDVPSLAGLTTEQARQLLEPRGLLLELTDQVEDARYRVGQICEQVPLSGSRVTRGSAVRAKVARAAEGVRVPELVGRPEAEAKGLLEAARLKTGDRSERPDAKAPAGSVVATNPPPGTKVPVGTSVALVVAATTLVEVPKVTGRGLGTAKQAITKAGLTVGEIKYGNNEDVDPGIVLKQTPAAAEKVPAGAKIDLLVNGAE